MTPATATLAFFLEAGINGKQAGRSKWSPAARQGGSLSGASKGSADFLNLGFPEKKDWPEASHQIRFTAFSEETARVMALYPRRLLWKCTVADS